MVLPLSAQQETESQIHKEDMSPLDPRPASKVAMDRNIAEFKKRQQLVTQTAFDVVANGVNIDNFIEMQIGLGKYKAEDVKTFKAAIPSAQKEHAINEDIMKSANTVAFSNLTGDESGTKRETLKDKIIEMNLETLKWTPEKARQFDSYFRAMVNDPEVSKEISKAKKAAGIIKDVYKSLETEIDPKKYSFEDARVLKSAFMDKDSPMKIPDDMTIGINLYGNTVSIPPASTWEKKGEIGAIETAKNLSLVEKIPFFGLGWKIGELIDIRSTANRIKEAQAEGKDIFSKEYIHDVEKLRDLWMVDEYRKARGQTWGGMAVDIGSELPGFLVEMWASGGLASVFKSGTKEMLSGLGKNILGRAVRGAAGLAAGATARTITTGIPRIAQGILQRTNPQAVFDGIHKVRIEESPEDLSSALLKSIGDTYIEYLSEDSGDVMGKLGSGALNSIMAKSPKFATVVNATKKAWMKAFGKTSAEWAAKLNSVGYHGVLAEMGEERLGDVLRSVTGVSDQSIEDALIPTKKQLKAELVTFAALGGGLSVISRVGQWRKDNPEAAEKLAGIERPSRKEFERLTGITKKTSEKERVEFVKEVAIQEESARTEFEFKSTEDARSRIAELQQIAETLPDEELGPIEEEISQIESQILKREKAVPNDIISVLSKEESEFKGKKAEDIEDVLVDRYDNWVKDSIDWATAKEMSEDQRETEEVRDKNKNKMAEIEKRVSGKDLESYWNALESENEISRKEHNKIMKGIKDDALKSVKDEKMVDSVLKIFELGEAKTDVGAILSAEHLKLNLQSKENIESAQNVVGKAIAKERYGTLSGEYDLLFSNVSGLTSKQQTDLKQEIAEKTKAILSSIKTGLSEVFAPKTKQIETKPKIGKKAVKQESKITDKDISLIKKVSRGFDIQGFDQEALEAESVMALDKAKKEGTFDESVGNYDAWASTVVRNNLISMSKKQKRTTAKETSISSDVIESTPAKESEALVGDFEKTAINDAVESLPEEQKAIVRGFMEGKSDTQMAEELGVSGTTIGNRRKAAFEVLEKQMRQKGVQLAESSLGFAGKADIPTEKIGVAPNPIGTEEVVRSMSEAFDVPIRTGRFRGKMSGIYKTLAKVVRTKKYADIAVASHEIAHSMSSDLDMKKIIPKEFKSELRSLDYDPAKLRLEEGWAEYIRYYLTTDEAGLKAPKFNAWFENWIKESKYAKAMSDTKKMISKWRTQGSVSRVAGQLSMADSRNKNTGALYVERGPLSKMWHGFLTMFTNRMHPLWDAQLAMARTLDLKELPYSDNFAAAAKVLTMVSSARAQAAVNDYMPNVMGERVGKSLKDILEPIANDLNQDGGMLAFESYIYARHALDVLEQGKDPGISQEDAQQVVERYGNRDGWEKASDGITDWHDQLLDYLIDAGGLTGEAKKIMRDMYPHYVPLQREVKGKHGGIGSNYANLPSGLKRLKGSGRMVISPLESSVQYAERIFSLSDKIRVGRMLIDASEKYGGMGKFIERVAPKGMVKDIKLEDISQQLEEAGIDMADADIDSIITIFENAYNGDPKDNVIALWRNGKKEMYQVDPDIYSALAGLDKQFHLPKVIEWTLGKPARLVRLGAVGIKASFGWVTNPLRDIQTAVQQTERKGFKGTLPRIMVDSIAGVIDDITGGDMSRLFKAGGGELAQPLGADRKFVRNAIKEAIANTPGRKAALWAKNPIESLRTLISIPELGPRIAEFKSALEENGWKKGDRLTFPQYVEAQLRAANVTVDFREGGLLSMWINRTNAFFNANIQGPNRMVQAIKNHPVSWTVRALSNITIPTMLMWFAYKDDDWYKDLPAWEKFAYWHVKVGDTVLRIPTPFEWFTVFGAIPLGALESAYRKDPKYISEAMKQVSQTATPDWLPTAAKPIIENMVNYDMFRDRSIISPWMEEHLNPEDQFYGYTTELAKKVGGLFGVSPAKFEHLLSSYTGGMATDAVKSSEEILRKIGVLPIKGSAPAEMSDIPIFGRLFLKSSANRVFDDFYTKLKELNQKYGSAKLLDTQLSGNEIIQRDAMSKVSAVLSEYRKETKAIIGDTEVSDQDKKNKILEIRDKMLSEARTSMENPKEVFRKYSLGSFINDVTGPSKSENESDYINAISIFSEKDRREAFDAYWFKPDKNGKKKTRGDAYRRHVIELRKLP